MTRSALGAALLLAAGAAAQQPPPAAKGGEVKANDAVGEELLALGDRLHFDLELRYRFESWSQFDDPSLPPAASDGKYGFHQLRTIAGLRYEAGPWRLQASALDVHLWNLPDNGTAGPGPLYFQHSGRTPDPGSLSVWHSFAQWQSDERGTWQLRLGRQALADGAFAPAEEPKWNRLRALSLTERLVGSFGWTPAGRSFDGFRAEHRSDAWFGQGWFARANAGAFDIDDAGKGLEDYWVGGAEWTARPGQLADAIELRGFAHWHSDDRPITRTTLGDALDVVTLGASAVSVGRLGCGQADALLWGAAQFGDFGTRDHAAYAWIAELGWQCTDAAWKPWLRAGHAWASGDGDPADGTNRSFFNGLPTNHKYYGYADVVAFSNLQDLYVQLFLHPGPSLELELAAHAFHAADASAPIAFGSGAFSMQSFGYGTRPTGGRSEIGHELDVVLTWRPLSKLDAQLGWAHFAGGAIFEQLFAEADVDLLYVQSTVRW